ncbi:MAG: hypothetical protein WC713_08355 [Candidatus Methylomirabilota bacterium]
MFATKPTELQPEVSEARHLLTLAVALAFFDALFYAIAELGLRLAGPSLRAMTVVGRFLAPHTDSIEAQVVVEALDRHEVYLQSQLQAAQAILLAAHDQYVFWLWKACVVGVCGFGALLFLVWNLSEWWQSRSLTGRSESRMGIRYEGLFVPCPLPAVQLTAQPYFPTLLERWTVALHLGAPPSRPPWAASLQPMSQLALAVLERYLAYPAWPADVPAADGMPSRHHGTATLGEHVAAVRARALELAQGEALSLALVEQVALAHDLGKLVTFQREADRWIRVLRHHDRMSSQILTALPEWQALPADDREDLRIAVRFHHASTKVPLDASQRALSLLAILARAHKQTARWEMDRAEGAGRSERAQQIAVLVERTPPASRAQVPAAAVPTAAPATPVPRPMLIVPSVPVIPSAAVSPCPAAAMHSVPCLDVILGVPAAELATPATPAPPETPAVAPPSSIPPATTPEAVAERSKVVPVQPELVDPLAQALVAALPHLEINALSMFAGLTIPDMDLVMLLDTRLRHRLCGQLTAQECGRLQLSAQELNSGTGAKIPVPHPSASNVAAAFRRLGWLVEEHDGQRGTLWQVDVGRRVWLACWLIRRSRLPVDVLERWPSRPKFPPKPSAPSWIDPWGPVLTATTSAIPDAGPQQSPVPIQPETHSAGPAGDRDACKPIARDGRGELPHQDGHDG